MTPRHNVAGLAASMLHPTLPIAHRFAPLDTPQSSPDPVRTGSAGDRFGQCWVTRIDCFADETDGSIAQRHVHTARMIAARRVDSPAIAPVVRQTTWAVRWQYGGEPRVRCEAAVPERSERTSGLHRRVGDVLPPESQGQAQAGVRVQTGYVGRSQATYIDRIDGVGFLPTMIVLLVPSVTSRNLTEERW
jgi:hypothetical protein